MTLTIALATYLAFGIVAGSLMGWGLREEPLRIRVLYGIISGLIWPLTILWFISEMI